MTQLASRRAQSCCRPVGIKSGPDADRRDRRPVHPGPGQKKLSDGSTVPPLGSGWCKAGPCPSHGGAYGSRGPVHITKTVRRGSGPDTDKIVIDVAGGGRAPTARFLKYRNNRTDTCLVCQGHVNHGRVRGPARHPARFQLPTERARARSLLLDLGCTGRGRQRSTSILRLMPDRALDTGR